MTFARLQRTLEAISKAGWVETSEVGAAKLLELQGRGFVERLGDDRWQLTHLGRRTMVELQVEPRRKRATHTRVA